MADSLILMVMALVVFGPRRLPQIGRQIGKLMYEFRKASNDFKFQMEEELRSAEEADRRKKEEERLKTLTLWRQNKSRSYPHRKPSPISFRLSPSKPSFPAIDSPSPDDGVIPVAADTVEAPIQDPTGEETTPRILPPSTGEQVFAARPHSLTALAKAAKEQNSADPALPPDHTSGIAPGIEVGAGHPWLMPRTQSARHGRR
jgi:sec-independent protein translocase protein TatB